MNTATDLRPFELRRIAEEGYKAGEGIFDMKDLDTCVAYNVEQEFHRSHDNDVGIAEWINKHITIQHTKNWERKSLKNKYDAKLVYIGKDGSKFYDIH